MTTPMLKVQRTHSLGDINRTLQNLAVHYKNHTTTNFIKSQQTFFQFEFDNFYDIMP